MVLIKPALVPAQVMYSPLSLTSTARGLVHAPSASSRSRLGARERFRTSPPR
jgi:hypothetical protein